MIRGSKKISLKALGFNQKHRKEHLKQLRRFSSETEDKPWDYDYDVLVCGGGVVGTSFVSKLLHNTQGGIRIGLLEQKPAPSLESCLAGPIDIRVYALSAKSVNFLNSIGAWESLSSRRQPYKFMQIWEENSLGLLTFTADELGVSEMGYIAEDRTINAAITESLQRHSQASAVDMIYGCNVINMKLPEVKSGSVGPVEVTVSGKDATPRTIRTRLVVGADGAQSTIRRMAGIATSGWGYGVDAVVATLKVAQAEGSEGSDPSSQTAWQKYLSSGPLALLPLWGPYRSIVWSVPSPEATRLKNLSNEDFLNELNIALLSEPSKPTAVDSDADGNSSFPSQIKNLFSSIRERSPHKTVLAGAELLSRPVKEIVNHAVAIGDTLVSASLSRIPRRVPPVIESLESNRMSFPLQLQQASTYAGSRVALIGDAAHTIHPQAGQGLNLGLQDAEDLANTIATALAGGADVADPSLLTVYSDVASRRANLMQRGVDTINTLFLRGNDQSASLLSKVTNQTKAVYPNFDRDYSTILSVGLAGVQVTTPIKKLFAKQAMGIE